MKFWVMTMALALGAESLSGGTARPVRSLWLRGEWARAEAQLRREETRARRAADETAVLRVLRDRVLLLLDRHSYSTYDPELTRVAVERFYELAARSNDPVLHADAIHAVGRYRYWQMFAGEGDWKSVRDLFTRALELRKVSGDRTDVADSHFYLGLVHQMQGEAGPARAEFELGMPYADGDPLMQSFLERHLGALDEDAGDQELARKRYVASLDMRRRAGATLLVPFALNLLAAHEAKVGGNTRRATALYRQASEVARRTRSNRALADAEGELARLAQLRGDLRAASKRAASSLRAARAHGDPELISEARERLTKIVSSYCKSTTEHAR